jgi:hypothetical protein
MGKDSLMSIVPFAESLFRRASRPVGISKVPERDAAGPYGLASRQIGQTRACATGTQATRIIPVRVFEIRPTRLTQAVLPFAGRRRIWRKLLAISTLQGVVNRYEGRRSVLR